MAKRERMPTKTASEFAQEAVTYFANARAILRSIPIRDERYLDVKRVREACGTAYLAVLAALRSYLLTQGWRPDKLPEEYTAYGQALARSAARNGKVMKAFHQAYSGIHLDGYYRGFSRVDFGKIAFAEAKFLIERLTARKVDGR